MRRSRVFSEEPEEAGILDEAESEAPAGEEPEYAFEGYEVEFSQKVMLTPLVEPYGKTAKG